MKAPPEAGTDSIFAFDNQPLPDRMAASSLPGKRVGGMKRAALFVGCVLLGAAGKINAAEPWADRALPRNEGLFLWLDASCQAEARTAAGLSVPTDGARVGVWYDGA